MPELFGTRVRYSGASLGCQVAAAISGGFSPIVATSLLAWTGVTWPISLFMVGLAAVTLAATLTASETRDLDIAHPLGAGSRPTAYSHIVDIRLLHGTRRARWRADQASVGAGATREVTA